MKRGIPIALQAAGAVLACLVTTLNHPVIAHAQPVYQDTVHYYNKHGKEIFCAVKDDTARNYIIRTSKTRRQVFDDLYGWNRTKNSNEYEPADVYRIARWKARKVRRLIRRGQVDDSLVVQCIVPILDKGTLSRMLQSIQESKAMDRLDGKFREYGGEINRDTTFECHRGDSTDPRRINNKGVTMKVGEKGNFHSHPDGEVKDITDGKTYCFVQGPSCDDQDILNKKTGYVFGMREDTKLIYVFNGRGVLAILPFKCLPFKTIKK